jgi:hypothetical protein
MTARMDATVEETDAIAQIKDVVVPAAVEGT